MKKELKKVERFHSEFVKFIDQIDLDIVKGSLYQSICNINWKLHTGRFACDNIENGLIKIGEKIQIAKKENEESKSKVLHVATQLYEIGGHTRLLESYFSVFSDFKNDLFLTNQLTVNLPERITNNKVINKIYDTCIEASFVEKSIELASIWKNYEFVILHIHPNDIIPNISFGIVPHEKIIFVNHADHVFG